MKIQHSGFKYTMLSTVTEKLYNCPTLCLVMLLLAAGPTSAYSKPELKTRTESPKHYQNLSSQSLGK